jgi:AAA15 family ATPase/GTPase
MIIEFSVRNYRSIKEMQTLNMLAAPIKSKKSELDTHNIIPISEDTALLKTVAIYGANGSGKSSLVKAMLNMLIFIRDSFTNDNLGEMIIAPFILNDTSENEPTFFQLIFICEGIKYRYGFEVHGNNVVSEWLFGTPGQKEIYYFKREGDNIEINKNKFAEGAGLKSKTSQTNLFLNIAKAFNGKVSKSILDFLKLKISINLGIGDMGFRDITLDALKEENAKKVILKLMNLADFGIKDLEHKKITEDDISGNVPKEVLEDVMEGNIQFVISNRSIIDKDGNEVGRRFMSLDNDESEGTRKLFNYSGAIVEALSTGNTIIIDEFDARLHPMITKRIVEMFHSPDVNKAGAQLIFVTHDTNLLDKDLLRRDQIYFVEKNSRFETELYSLADFKGVRNDASYEKDYIKGKYGAIPFLGDFTKLLD